MPTDILHSRINDSPHQREGMGLLEYYRAIPSLRDVAHDGWLCYFLCTFQYNRLSAAGNSISSQLDSSCQGNRYGSENVGVTARPSHTKSHLQPARWDAVLGQLSSLWPHWTAPPHSVSFSMIYRAYTRVLSVSPNRHLYESVTSWYRRIPLSKYIFCNSC